MQAGRLDRRVRILRLIETPDSFGQMVPTPQEFATVWAELLPPRGGEVYVADGAQRSAVQTAQFRVRYLKGITPKMILAHQSQAYDITDVAELERGSELVLTCEAREATPQGGA